jgi:hypothetical protein
MIEAWMNDLLDRPRIGHVGGVVDLDLLAA